MPSMTKRVNVKAPVAIRTITPPIYGTCNNIIMTTGDILKCICKKAIVEEILPDGSTVRLNMRNYYTDNGAGLDAKKTVDNTKKEEDKVPEAPVTDANIVEPDKEQVIDNTKKKKDKIPAAPVVDVDIVEPDEEQNVPTIFVTGTSIESVEEGNKVPEAPSKEAQVVETNVTTSSDIKDDVVAEQPAITAAVDITDTTENDTSSESVTTAANTTTKSTTKKKTSSSSNKKKNNTSNN